MVTLIHYAPSHATNEVTIRGCWEVQLRNIGMLPVLCVPGKQKRRSSGLITELWVKGGGGEDLSFWYISTVTNDNRSYDYQGIETFCFWLFCFLTRDENRVSKKHFLFFFRKAITFVYYLESLSDQLNLFTYPPPPTHNWLVRSKSVSPAFPTTLVLTRPIITLLLFRLWYRVTYLWDWMWDDLLFMIRETGWWKGILGGGRGVREW